MSKKIEEVKQEKRSRGKFKPEMRNLSADEVREILLKKISEEELSVPVDEKDYQFTRKY
ncbi:hypothetical protein [Streptococcus sp. Marseille-Q5986]|uniref:hypothetical protein n=1 Tax=Streptococcus sp. Marseille-Q5986 TaxID=2972782 RepID=UPI0022645A70|nr:hypothetical protein [Streptococcus sp. Marseille-Q5986]